MSGTSMAVPQVAGMAALVAQYIRENGLKEKTGVSVRHLAQSLLMSTAEPVYDASTKSWYSILRQGAGLANVSNAIHAESYVLVDGQPDGKVKVELGDDPDRTGVYSADFTLNNLTDEAIEYTLSADVFTQAPVSSEGVLYLLPKTVSMAANVVWTVDGKVLTAPSELTAYDFDKDGDTDADDAQLLLDDVTAGAGKLKADVDVSSVVPQLVNIIKAAVEKTVGITPLMVGPGIKTGLNILMDQPRQVGTDMIVDAVATLNGYGAPAIIIDMGTATTISVVDEKENYIGGVILPGIRVSVDSLVSRTAQLPRISLDTPKSVMGKNTIDCMKSGVIYGNASCIDGMLDRIIEANGFGVNGKPEAKVIATGGLAKVIVPHCKHNIHIDAELLLKGLRIIYDKNVEGN